MDLPSQPPHNNTRHYGKNCAIYSSKHFAYLERLYNLQKVIKLEYNWAGVWTQAIFFSSAVLHNPKKAQYIRSALYK